MSDAFWVAAFGCLATVVLGLWNTKAAPVTEAESAAVVKAKTNT